MSKIWIQIPKRRKRVWLDVLEEVRLKKFKRFVRKIFDLEEPFIACDAAESAGVTRETAEKYIAIMEQNGLVNSATIGKSSMKVYFVSTGTLLEELEKLIRCQPGCLTEIYNNFRERIVPSLDQIIRGLEPSRSF